MIPVDTSGNRKCLQSKKNWRKCTHVLKVNKTFNVNLNFLYVEFLEKIFNSKLRVPDHFPGANHSKHTCLWLRNKGKKATHTSQSKVEVKRIPNCSLLWTISVNIAMTRANKPPAQPQQRECFNKKKESLILPSSAPNMFSSTGFGLQNLNL